MTAVGTPPAASSPTPPEGDLWLLAGSDPSNYWQLPVGALPLAGAFVGCLCFEMIYQNSGSGQEEFFRFGNGNSYRWSMERVAGFLRTVFSYDTNGNFYSLEFPDTFTPGDKLEIRIEVRNSGTILKVNGVQVSTAHQVVIWADSFRAIGGQQTGNTAYQDAFMLSSDPDEVYPPVFEYPPIVTGVEAMAT